MFCPQCRSEYREGFTVCADCQVELVASLPEPAPVPNDERPNMEFVTVFDSTNPALISIAKTVLESAAIEFLAVGADTAGAVFAGNPFLGHTRLQVEKDRAEEARTLLSEISESEEPFEDEL